MKKTLKTWVLVADSAKARFLRTDENETSLRPVVLANPVAEEVDRHARDVNSDRPGRSFSSASGGPRHAFEPQHDPHKMQKHKFVAALAWALDCAYAAGDFDRLVLVVPPRTLGEMRLLLPDRVQSHMQVIAKDMVAAPIADLWREIAKLVRHRPLSGAAF